MVIGHTGLRGCFSTLFFYGIGNNLKIYIFTIIESSKKRSILLLSVFLLLNFTMFLINVPRLDLVVNQIGRYILGYIGALTGIGGILYLSHYIDLCNFKIKNIFKYLGQNTFVILTFHQFLSPIICKYLETLPIPYLLNSLLRQALLWNLLFLLIIIGNKCFFSWILSRNHVRD